MGINITSLKSKARDLGASPASNARPGQTEKGKAPSSGIGSRGTPRGKMFSYPKVRTK